MIRCYTCQVKSDDNVVLTIDELAAATATTSRRIRSLQTLGLLPHPTLRGRTGLYDAGHRDRLAAILHLQEQGFSLESLRLLFDAVESGRSLAAVLGLPEPAAPAESRAEGGADSAELYGFAELQPATAAPQRGGLLLSVVPTTVWDESQAS
jgi:DNA-binding transcriptional MerR regulator